MRFVLPPLFGSFLSSSGQESCVHVPLPYHLVFFRSLSPVCILLTRPGSIGGTLLTSGTTRLTPRLNGRVKMHCLYLEHPFDAGG